MHVQQLGQLHVRHVSYYVLRNDEGRVQLIRPGGDHGHGRDGGRHQPHRAHAGYVPRYSVH